MSQFSPSAWVLGIALQAPGWLASAFTHRAISWPLTESSYLWFLSSHSVALCFKDTGKESAFPWIQASVCGTFHIISDLGSWSVPLLMSLPQIQSLENSLRGQGVAQVWQRD